MKRKDFLIHTSLTAFALSSFGFVVKNSDGQFSGDCDTTNDILGPFYRPKAPIRSDLTYEGLSGTRIELKGKVFKSDCTTVLKNALVEIWHCNSEGEYDNDTPEFRQRGSLKTNKKGGIRFYHHPAR